MSAPDFNKPRVRIGAKAFSAFHSFLYRLFGGRGVGGGSVLLLTTIGRKSGQPRTKPVMYCCDGDDLVVVASRAGTEANPLWYKNLVKTPQVRVQVGGVEETRVARTASAEEKARLWPKVVEVYADFDTYQARTSRDIPIVILSKS